MSYQVRQLSFGEILDQSFRVLRDNFAVLTTIMAIFYVPYSLVMPLLKPRAEAGVPEVPDFGAAMIGLAEMLLMFAALPLTQLAATRAVSDAYLNAPMTVAEAYRAALKIYARYMRTCLLVGLALLGAFFLLIVPALYFGVSWAVVGPVGVVESTFGRAAMKRSRALTKGHWWRTCGVFLVAFVIAAVVGAGVNSVLGAIPVLGAALTGLVQSIAGAYTSIVLVVLYVDLRCRHEDFDLQLLASQVAASAALPRTGAIDAARV